MGDFTTDSRQLNSSFTSNSTKIGRLLLQDWQERPAKDKD
jgi:hypothetical protein